VRVSLYWAEHIVVHDRPFAVDVESSMMMHGVTCACLATDTSENKDG
jgi:hypothetical protein